MDRAAPWAACIMCQGWFGLCLASLLLIQLLAKVPGKAVDNGSSIWVPAPDVEDWAGIPGPLVSEWSNSVGEHWGSDAEGGRFLALTVAVSLVTLFVFVYLKGKHNFGIGAG